MPSWTRALTVGLVGVLATASHDAQAQDQQPDILAAERIAAELSRDSGFTRGLLANIHNTAVLLWPGAPVVVGTADIRQLLAKVDSDSLLLTWQTLRVKLAQDSSLAATWGVLLTGNRRNATSARIGRYIATWRRDGTRWSIAAVVLTGIDALPPDLPPQIPRLRPAMKATGPAAGFVAADLSFARLAGDSGARVAFERWAAPGAAMFGAGELLVMGPHEIGEGVAGPEVWRWYPVAAGASLSGDMGWTAGQAVIGAVGAEPSYSKYLTVWIRLPDRSIRFLTDGGNSRPRAES